MSTEVLNDLKEEFQKIKEHFQEDLKKVQAGRANASLVEDVAVDSYGTLMNIKSVATISIPDSTTISINPWDKSNLSAIEKAIIKADLGVNPKNDGQAIIIAIPPMTSEKRDEIIKKVHQMLENARISIRNTRQNYMKKIKKMKEDDEISEDEQKKLDQDIQKETTEMNQQLEEISQKKEESIKSI